VERPTGYAAAGVNTARAEGGLQRLISRIRGTFPPPGSPGAVQLDVGYFANVVDVGGMGIAITTDGVGSKVLIAQMLNRYDTVGIDCVAMNVNDLLCVGATPVSLVDYLAVQDASPEMLDAIAAGLCEGARQAGVSIPGGEIAQLRDIITGVRDGAGFDLAAAAIGTVPLDRILVGQDIVEGDAIVGIASSGIHSNGLTLARSVLLEQGGLSLDEQADSLGNSLGEELLRPTSIYVPEALEMMRDLAVRAFMHITGDGFLNLARVVSETGFVVDALPEPSAIFRLIQRIGSVSDAEMYSVFNMSVGFCAVVAAPDADRVISIAAAHGRQAWVIGHTVHDADRRVWLPTLGLVSSGKTFVTTA
jgi:phosphoribosylformylglycinamidine cyclo-ligase